MGKRGKLLKKKKVESLLSSTIDDPVKTKADKSSDNESDSEGDSDSSDGMDCDMLGGLTEGEVATAIKVVSLLGSRLELFRSRPFKPFRVAIHPLISEQMRRYEISEGGSARKGRGNKRDRSEKDVGADIAGSNRGRLIGLSASERLKQMDRDAMNARLHFILIKNSFDCHPHTLFNMCLSLFQGYYELNGWRS
jgi:hypothetical protein